MHWGCVGRDPPKAGRRGCAVRSRRHARRGCKVK
nr:MAG TPA: hypothetical protein [Caudoviricetes sp.]